MWNRDLLNTLFSRWPTRPNQVLMVRIISLHNMLQGCSFPNPPLSWRFFKGMQGRQSNTVLFRSTHCPTTGSGGGVALCRALDGWLCILWTDTTAHKSSGPSSTLPYPVRCRANLNKSANGKPENYSIYQITGEPERCRRCNCYVWPRSHPVPVLLDQGTAERSWVPPLAFQIYLHAPIYVSSTPPPTRTKCSA